METTHKPGDTCTHTADLFIYYFCGTRLHCLQHCAAHKMCFCTCIILYIRHFRNGKQSGASHIYWGHIIKLDAFLSPVMLPQATSRCFSFLKWRMLISLSSWLIHSKTHGWPVWNNSIYMTNDNTNPFLPQEFHLTSKD